MHLMIEKGMRGGVTVATKRFAKANNKYLKDYDPTKPSTYIMYYDANNLYGCAMVDMLPKDGFRWMQELPTEEEIMRKTANHPKGWILKVDLLYPKELHDEHNDFPLAPEIRRVMEEEYSDWQKKLYGEAGTKTNKKQETNDGLFAKKRLRGALQEFAVLYCAWNEAYKGEKRHRIQPREMDERLHRNEHRKAPKSEERVRKGLFQTDEQRGFRENDGEQEEPDGFTDFQ